MKTAAVAPSHVAARGVSLLHFYRDVLDRLALWRLTERDEALLEAMVKVADDLTASCASITRQLRRTGLLSEPAKIVRLPSFNNPGNNPEKPGV